MTFTDLYKTILTHKYYAFSLEDLLTFYPQQKRLSLKRALNRWKAKGRVSSLKRGLYEMVYPHEYNIPDMYIANVLYSPSYISLETALSNYSIIPEVAMAVTSITTKPTRQFRNKHGFFIYHTVKPAAFSGYLVERQRDFDILIAEPEKALVDFLYFKGYRHKKIDFAAERLNRNVILRLDKKKIGHYAKVYNLDLGEFYAWL